MTRALYWRANSPLRVIDPIFVSRHLEISDNGPCSGTNSLDRRKVEFPAFSRWRAGGAIGIEQRDRHLVPDRPMRANLVVVSAPILHLFGRVGKRQEPVGVQALRPEATVEGFDVGVVGRLSGRVKSSVTPFA